MSDQYSFVVVTYPGRDTAIAAFNVLTELEQEKEIDVADDAEAESAAAVDAALNSEDEEV